MLAVAANDSSLMQHPAGILAVLLSVLALIFWLAAHPAIGRVFKIVPALVFCYFVPTLLTTLGIIPDSSPLYSWIKTFVLPASLLLMVLALDLPGILRLGPKALVMLLTGTFSVVIGGPIALLVTGPWLPDDAWRGLSALAGSWIGGGANFVAIGEAAEASDTLMATMVIPDVFCANVWTGILLFLSGRQHRIDAKTGANTQALRDLESRLTEFQARTTRVPSLADLLMILALGFGASWLSYKLGWHLYDGLEHLANATDGSVLTWLSQQLNESIKPSTWKFIIVTTLGVALSFTRLRNLEGAGASKMGSVMIYLLVACIGASADFRKIVEAPEYVLTGFVWIVFHIVIMLVVGRLIRAPLFFVAVASQANIGGAASAPVVASAFHPSLAPVGALLAVAGYVLGTYCGLLCMYLLKIVAGV